jgi:hypothetical protein
VRRSLPSPGAMRRRSRRQQARKARATPVRSSATGSAQTMPAPIPVEHSLSTTTLAGIAIAAISEASRLPSSPRPGSSRMCERAGKSGSIRPCRQSRRRSRPQPGRSQSGGRRTRVPPSGEDHGGAPVAPGRGGRGERKRLSSPREGHRMIRGCRHIPTQREPPSDQFPAYRGRLHPDITESEHACPLRMAGVYNGWRRNPEGSAHAYQGVATLVSPNTEIGLLAVRRTCTISE